MEDSIHIMPVIDISEEAIQIENFPKHRLFLRYKKTDVQEAFQAFWRSRFDKEKLSLDVIVTIVISTIFLLRVFFPRLVMYAIEEADVLMLLSFGFQLLSTLCAVILVALHTCSPESFIRQAVGRHRLVVKVYALYFCNILLIISGGLNMLVRVFNGTCSSSSPYLSCYGIEGGIPPVHVIILVLFCQLTVINCRGLVSFSHFLILFVMFGLFFLVSLLHNNINHPGAGLFVIPTVALVVISQGIVYQAMTTFEYHIALKQALAIQLLQVQEQAENEKQHLKLVLANVAHDLKTPLQAFSAGIHSLSSTPPDSFTSDTLRASFFSILEDMDASYAFMMMQINRALDVSKSDMKADLIPTAESFLLASPVKWAMGIMRSIQGRVSIVLGDGSNNDEFMGKTIISDKGWFQENLLCLLSNAVKYSPPDTTVTVSLSRLDKISPLDDSTQEYISVEVRDEGIGVSEEMRQKLFKPFTQTMRRAGGTGLGLYSLALRIQALGGEYGVSPVTEGQGSIFYFSIPYREDSNVSLLKDYDSPSYLMRGVSARFNEEPMRTGSNSISSVNIRSNADGKTFMVLVVDDSAPTLKLLSRAIKKSGAVVDQASDGCSALRLMKATLYTAVLMDIQMPIMVCIPLCFVS